MYIRRVAVFTFFFSTLPFFAQSTSKRLDLHDGWQLQSSCIDRGAGDVISKEGFDAKGWHKTLVPATVMAALVADGTYPDPFFGKNLERVPGFSAEKENFSNLPMRKDSPFRCSWWYRTEFELPASFDDQ